MVEINDPRLRESLVRHRPVIEGAEGRLDAVSADIKEFEKYLIDNADQQIVFEMSGGVTLCPEIDEQEGMPIFCGGELIEGEFEYLLFEEFMGRWRLTYRSTETSGHYGLDPIPNWTEEKVIEHRPLIETKADVRVRALRQLPMFVETVARQLAFDEQDFNSTVIPF